MTRRHSTFRRCRRVRLRTLAMMSFCHLFAIASASHTLAAPNGDSNSLNVLVPLTPPMAVHTDDGKLAGAAVDLLELLSKQHARPLVLLPADRTEIIRSLADRSFELAIAYEDPQRDKTLVNLGVIREVPIVRVHHSSRGSTPARIGFLHRIPPPAHLAPASSRRFDDDREAIEALLAGDIESLVLPMVAAKILQSRFDQDGAEQLTTSPDGSWPLVLYGNPQVISASDAASLSNTLSRVGDSMLFDRFVERFYTDTAEPLP